MNFKQYRAREILELLTSVSQKLEDASAGLARIRSAKEKKESLIDTIHASMYLETRRLPRETTAKIIHRVPIIGLQYLKVEIYNAEAIYRKLKHMDPYTMNELHQAHVMIMKNTQKWTGGELDSGRFRSDVAINFDVSRHVLHECVDALEARETMEQLFDFLRSGEDPLVIKGILALYAMESVRPYDNFSGFLGRLWVTLLLRDQFEGFEHVPWVKRVYETREEYYRVLLEGEESGHPTEFLRFMLHLLDDLLDDFKEPTERIVSSGDRLEYFRQLDHESFTRKDYMKVFRNISGATASRDLARGVRAGFLIKTGTKNITLYTLVKTRFYVKNSQNRQIPLGRKNI
jgi:Fic family protein